MSPAIAALRNRVSRLERPVARDAACLPFGLPDIDTYLPEAGLRRAALHEIAGGGGDEIAGACAALFAAGILARLHRPVLWCSAWNDLFPPGLATAGLMPERILHVAAPHDRDVLPVMEEALRHNGLAAVVGELPDLPMVASRRLTLAAERSGVMALALRRRHETGVFKAAPNAAATRWRVTPLPSAELPHPGVGQAVWHLALTRCRGGEPAEWIVEACDAQGRLALPAYLANRQMAKGELRRAAG